jgi:Trk-type K+ transport system membrane component
MSGALIILASLDHTLIPAVGDRIFFSVFHSVSAFCNAGFSTLTNSLFETGFRFNYTFHLTVAALVIIGGIGFPIVFTTLSYLKHFFLEAILKREKHKPWLLGINSRIVIITTVCLLFFGTVIIFGLEYNNTLAEHHGIGKVITAFFSATTPRTAGFNSVDMTALHFSTIMVLFILMWIGASPGSTGGGIKTSTFAIAVMNFMSLARGKDRVEVFRREISPISTRRAFAAISLSMVVIGISVLILTLTEKGKDLMPLAFETVSAFGTVGLSLGITSSLTDAGKIIIILTMFIGRVSMLAILVSFLRRVVNLKYKYPAEDVLIN